MTSSGWQVAIISPYLSDVADLPYHETYRISGRSTVLGRLRRLGGLLRLGYRNNPDVYHVHELDSLLVALILARLRDARVVYDCHEYHAEAVTENRIRARWLRTLVARLIGMAELAMAKASSLVIVVNDHLSLGFRGAGCRTITLPNYPLLSQIPSTKPSRDLASRYGGNTVLLYIGKLSPQRGITTALEVIAKLSETHPELRLVLVGRPHTRAYGVQLQRLIHDLRLEGIVELIGQIPHHDIAGYLALADVGLFLLQPTSERYNWGEPIKLFEYSAASLPVVISDLPAKRQLIEIMQNGLLVDPLAPNEIAEAISSLLADPHLREDMGKRGFAAFCDRYNWEQIEGRLTSAYQEMMEEI